MVFVSACLWGKNCKYSGGNNLRNDLKEELKSEEVVLICPECDGGLPTPRPASEICGENGGESVLKGEGKVINCEGEDVTHEFVKGAEYALELALKLKPEKIYLKQGSPSCGCGRIYDGTFKGNCIKGDGVTSALLKNSGFKVFPIE